MKAATKNSLILLASTVWLGCLVLSGQGAPARDRTDHEHELLQAVNSFLTTWLVRADANTAMRSVSPNPILGDCSLPASLDSSRTLSPQAYRKAIWDILAGVVRTIPAHQTLAAAVHPLGSAPPEVRAIQLGQHFDLFSLREPRDARFICKFDSSLGLRKRLARTGVWYSTFALTGPGNQESNWILAWVRERGTWRLISIALLED